MVGFDGEFVAVAVFVMGLAAEFEMAFIYFEEIFSFDDDVAHIAIVPFYYFEFEVGTAAHG